MSKKSEKTKPINNWVAKHARRYNKASVHIDKKKAEKKGYRKHSGQNYSKAA